MKTKGQVNYEFQYPSRRVVLPNTVDFDEQSDGDIPFQYPSRRVVLPNVLAIKNSNVMTSPQFQYPSRRVVLPN